MNDELEQTLYNDYMKQGSSRISDTFRPQLIQIDMQDIPFKENSDSDSMPQIQSAQNIRYKNISLCMNNESDNKNNGNREIFSMKSFQPQNNLNEKNEKGKQVRNSGVLKMMLINKLLKQFAEKIKKRAYILPTNKRDQIIQGLEDNYQKRKNVKKKSKLILLQNQELKKKITQKLPVFNPASEFMIAWEFFRAVQLMILLWWLPFKIAFQPSSNKLVEVFETSLTYIFAVDLIIKFNRGIFDQGQLIKKRIHILKHYLRNEVHEDIIYFITLLLVINTGFKASAFQEIIVLLQFGLNFIKLKKYLNKYEESFVESSTLTEIVNLIQLIIITFYFAHFMACVWYYVGVKSTEVNQISWTQSPEFDNQDTLQMYVYSFYWATTTMVTVGYGDISGKNVYEVLCAIVLMIFSSGIFAFSMNQIGSIFTNMDAQKQHYKRTLLLINQYMNNNQVEEQLQSRIRNYLKYHYNKQEKLLKNEINSIVDKLPSNLKQELIQDVQFRVMQCIPFFNKNFSEEILPQIACELNLQSYTPREIIYSENQLDDCNIFIVWKGEINLIDDNSGKILRKFTKGECFGELEFLTGQKRHGTAISCDFSQIYHISRNQFLKILNSYNHDFQQYHQLKDSILFQYNSPLHCYCCQESHSIWKCPYIHYKPDIERVIKKDFFKESIQDRSQFKRKGLKLNVFRQESVFQSTKHIKTLNDIDNVGIQQIGSISESVESNEDSIKIEKKSDQILTVQYGLAVQTDQKRRSIRQKQLQIPASPLMAESPQRRPAEVIKYSQKPRKSIFFGGGDQNLLNLLGSKRHESVLKTGSLHQQERTSGFESENNNNVQEPFFQLEHLDKMIEYNNYFPHNNYEKVVEQYLRYMKKLRLGKKVMIQSKYAFVRLEKIERSHTKKANSCKSRPLFSCQSPY